MLFKALFLESSCKWIKSVFLLGLPALSLANATAAPGGAELQKAQHVAVVSALALAGWPAQAVSWHLEELLGSQIFRL